MMKSRNAATPAVKAPAPDATAPATPAATDASGEQSGATDPVVEDPAPPPAPEVVTTAEPAGADASGTQPAAAAPEVMGKLNLAQEFARIGDVPIPHLPAGSFVVAPTYDLAKPISRLGLPEMIVITARVDGFRRAGLAHPARPVPHRTDDFTDEQLLQLLTEPNLVVVPKAD